MLLGLLSTGFLVGLASSFFPLQQFLDPSFRLFGTVQAKIQLGRSPDPQPLYQLVTDVFTCRFQSFYTPIGFRVVALHIDPDLGGSSIVRDMHRGHTHQADAGISQFPFHQSFDFFAKGLADPSAMVSQPALLHDSTLGKTVENIRKLDAGVGLSATG
jgi:hypothetical protein